MSDKLEYQEIRALGLFPASLQLKHPDTKVVLLDNYMRRSLSMIHGVYRNEANVAMVDKYQALRVAAHGTGFEHYVVASGTAPDDFDVSDEVNDTFTYHRWDILIESEQAEIRFVEHDSVFGDAIPLVVGFHSLLFTSFRAQIRKRNATAGTYTITAYRGHTFEGD